MNSHLLIFFTAIYINEIVNIFNLKDNIRQNLIVYKKIINLFNQKKISDFRKEKLIFSYSKQLLFSSIKILLIFFCIIMPILLFGKFFNSFFNLILSINGSIELFLIFIIYHKLRKKINAKL